MSTWESVTDLLVGIPELPGARCRGRADLFESTIAEHRVDGRPTKAELDTSRAAALRLCGGCPALDPCRAWLDGVRPSQRPRGVVAGLIVKAAGDTLDDRETT